MKSLIAVLATATVALSACGGSAVTAHKVAQNPHAQRDAARVQKIVQTCAASNKLWKKAGRHAFYACVAPPGKQKAIAACAQKSAVSHNLLRKRGRRAFMADVEGCILR